MAKGKETYKIGYREVRVKLCEEYNVACSFVKTKERGGRAPREKIFGTI